MTYLIAINHYRSSTDAGFANSWGVYRCKNRAHQKDLLTRGLPTDDVWFGDSPGPYTTMGIRPVTRAERREAQFCLFIDVAPEN